MHLYITSIHVGCTLPLSRRTPVSKASISNDCPNYYVENEDGDRIFYNFFWNDPSDQATYTAAFVAQMVRSQIESRPIFHEIYPGIMGYRSVSYRVVVTKGEVSVQSRMLGAAV